MGTEFVQSALILLGLIHWIAIAPLSAFASEPDGQVEMPEASPLTLSRAIQIAMENNLELRAAAADLAAARGRLEGAEILTPHNPELSGGVSRRFAPAGDATEADASLSQELEIAGQRSQRIAAARANLSNVSAAIEHLRLQIASDVKVAFTDALAKIRMEGFALDAEILAKELYQTAVDRRDAGAATDLEVNLAGIERAQARRVILLASRARADSLAELRRLLALPPGGQLPIEGDLVPTERLATDPTTLERRALAGRHDLESLDHLVRAQVEEIELARSEAWPNLTLSATYSHEEGTDHIMGVGLSIPLPLFNRNQGRIAEARARAERARSQLESGRLLVQREVALAYRRYQTAREVVEVFDRNILAQVTENLQLLRTSFRAGKIGPIQVLLVQRDLVRTRQEYIESVAELLRARARLELAVGGEVQ